MEWNYKSYRITEYDELGSTNSFLNSLAKSQEESERVVTARFQTSGRGRHGKSFFSPQGTGLYMSVLKRPDMSIEQAMLITPAVACAVAESLERILKIQLGIKWVNDIFLCGKKICGILTESGFDFENNRLKYAVIGIGINLCEPEGGFPKEIKETAGALFQEPPDEEVRRSILTGVLDGLDKTLPQCKTGGFLSDYRRRSVVTGKTVRVILNGRQFDAKAVGIDDRARLIVEADGKTLVLDSGEVSIKL